MKYISIGHRCYVKYNIDKYKGKCETLFFDWLMTSMKSVIEILGCHDINNILYFDNIIRDIKYPFNIEDKNARVIIKSLDLCVSVHDLPGNYTDKDILDFIIKYKKRFNYIIEYIKSNEKICFIRGGYVSQSDADKFIETILKINNNCDFILVIIHNDKENNNEIIKHNKILYIKLNIDIPSDFNWRHEFLNWEKIFIDIENNIEK